MTTLHAQAGASAGRMRRIEAGVVLPLVRKELRDALRNRWIILYTLGFCALAIGLAALARASAGYAGFAGFGRTAASLINLVLLLVPLMALSVGAASIAPDRERGTLAYLLAQPVTRSEVFLARFLGLSLAMLASVGVGFGCAAIVLSWSGGGDAWLLVRMTLLAGALAVAMLAVGMLLSTLARRASAAAGSAIFAWLAFVLLADVGVMGASLLFRLRVEELFFAAVANPLQAFKMAALQGYSASLDVLGPAGLYATQTFGAWLPAILLGSIALWILLPLTGAWLLFIRRPL